MAHKASLGEGSSSFLKWRTMTFSFFFLLLIKVMILSYVFIDLNCFVRWAMWPMGLLFLYIFQFFSIYCHFPEIKLTLTIYWNHCYYTLRERSSGGVYRNHSVWTSVHLSVLLSVCLSVWLPSVNMILSTHVLGNGSIDFFWKFEH